MDKWFNDIQALHTAVSAVKDCPLFKVTEHTHSFAHSPICLKMIIYTTLNNALKYAFINLFQRLTNF